MKQITDLMRKQGVHTRVRMITTLGCYVLQHGFSKQNPTHVNKKASARISWVFFFFLVIRQSRLCGKGEVHLLCSLTFPSWLNSKAGSYHPAISRREERLTCPLLTRAGNAGETQSDIMAFSTSLQHSGWCSSREHTLLQSKRKKVILPFPNPLIQAKFCSSSSYRGH